MIDPMVLEVKTPRVDRAAHPNEWNKHLFLVFPYVFKLLWFLRSHDEHRINLYSLAVPAPEEYCYPSDSQIRSTEEAQKICKGPY